LCTDVHNVPTPTLPATMSTPADAINVNTAEEATRHLESTKGIGNGFRLDSSSMRRGAIARGDGRVEYGPSTSLHRSASSVPEPIAEGDEQVTSPDADPLQRRDPTLLDLASEAGFVRNDSDSGTDVDDIYIPSMPLMLVPHMTPGKRSHKPSPPDAYFGNIVPSVGTPQVQSHNPQSASLTRKHAYSHSLTRSVGDRTISIDLLCVPGCDDQLARSSSYARASHPTGSRPHDPGPYHRANSRLREMLRNYTVKVLVTTSWIHVFLTALAVVAFCGYIGIRGWYLISGKSSNFNAQDVSVAYSWVVLSAEVSLGFLGFYGHQTYWKQTTTFREMTDDEEKTMIDVQPPSSQTPLLACPNTSPSLVAQVAPPPVLSVHRLVGDETCDKAAWLSS
jgi:hypothetical protein